MVTILIEAVFTKSECLTAASPLGASIIRRYLGGLMGRTCEVLQKSVEAVTGKMVISTDVVVDSANGSILCYFNLDTSSETSSKAAFKN